MPKCNKVKNPCKICLEPVSYKNGLQCQGACESWVHYSCLNYTPGKVKDIKAGIIKVTCPCPDCKTSLPKEYRTDEPYSCTNIQCPANRPPHCENKNCSLNSETPEKMNQTLVAPPCPLKECGNSCKQHSTPHVSNISKLPIGGSSTPSQISSSYDCVTPKKCSSGCTSSTEIPGGDVRRNATVDLAGMPALIAVEQMCNTVGQLTNELNQMMMNLKQAIGRKGLEEEGGCAHENCQQKRPKSLCPKSCYCPGNPGRGRRR